MKRLSIIMMFVATMFLTGCGIEIVDTGHRGIETKWGKVVNDIPYEEGLYLYNPISTSIRELDIREQKWVTTTKAYTKDVQEAKIELVLNYRLRPLAVTHIFQEVGVNWADILIPQAIIGPVKDVVGTWDAEDLIGERDKAASELRTLVEAKLDVKQVDLISLEITDIGYSEKFEHSVEAKVIEEQNAIKATHVTNQSLETKKQKIYAAEAEAESIKIRGEALEKNSKLVDLIIAEKWNGVLPQYMLGGAPVPFMNLDKLGK